MPTISIIPSTYTRSNTNYVTVTDPNNMYNTTSHTSSYATLRGRAGRSSNSTYYAFIHGFQFDDLPDNAVVESFRILIRAYRGTYMASGVTNYRIKLASQASNSYAIGNTTLSEDITTTSGGTVYEIPHGSLTWAQIVEYGAGFSIDIPLRNSSTSSNNYPYVYVYGAEIEVTYSIPNPRTVTTSLTGDGTIDPSGTQTMSDGDEYNLVIEPTNASDTVTVKRNGTDITSQIAKHQGGEYNESNVLGTYHLVSGRFNGSGATYFQGLVGKGHTATATTSNYYSSGSGSTAVFQYAVPFEVPDNATITSLYMMANGHAESTSSSSEYMCVQLKSGSTALSAQYNFKSAGTSNSTQTINATTLPTPAQLADLVVECTLGYYGGALNGVTVFLEYEVSGVWYTYSETISGDLTIAVTISGGAATNTIYIKVNGSWVGATAAYKKLNGLWVLQSDMTTVFDSNTNYVKG